MPNFLFRSFERQTLSVVQLQQLAKKQTTSAVQLQQKKPQEKK
jgi:hypothetical protein